MSKERTRNVAEQARNLKDLRDQLHFFTAHASVTQEELIASIEESLSVMRRVNTPNALALAAIVEPKLAEVKAQFGRVDRTLALKDLALWLGSVKVGWL